MSSFFTVPASQRKRKRQETASALASKIRNSTSERNIQFSSKPKPRKDRDESISGSESEDNDSNAQASADDSDASSDSGANETAAERRLKLAERYLENIRAEVGEGQEVGFDAEEIDRELIAERLKEDVAEEKGRVYRRIAGELDFDRAMHTSFRADTLATNGVAVCPPYAYTVSKDITLIKWELSTLSPLGSSNGNSAKANVRRKPKQLAYTKGDKRRANNHSYQHHTAAILCVAASLDGRFVVTGGADRRLIVWDAESLQPLKVFTQHRDSVTAVAFRGKTNQLFSASKDRTIKIYSLNELAYIETLFGHQDEVVDITAVGGNQERCLSVGARDRTARLWKVVEESQLVFRGGGTSKFHDSLPGIMSHNAGEHHEAPLKFSEGSLDRVIQLDTQLFVTGSDSGALSLYSLHKKKALHTVPLAHGIDPPLPPEEASAEMVPKADAQGQPTPRWITALVCVPFSDLFLSGSWDGWVRAWKVSGDLKKIEAVGVVGHVEGLGAEQVEQDGPQGPVHGVINDLAVFERGDRGKEELCVVAAVGKEGRLGRWLKVKGRSGAMVFDVPRLSLDSKTNGLPQGDEALDE